MSKWLGLSALMRGLRPGLVVLNDVGNSLGLPEVVRRNALKIYKRCIGKSLTQGRRREILIGACLLISYQGHNYPVNLKHLSNACECTRFELFRTKKFIKQFIKLNEGFVDPAAYISRYCYELGLSEDDKTRALKELVEVIEVLPNKSSQLQAAVSVYLTGKTSIRALARTSGLSKTSISSSCCQN